MSSEAQDGTERLAGSQGPAAGPQGLAGLQDLGRMAEAVMDTAVMDSAVTDTAVTDTAVVNTPMMNTERHFRQGDLPSVRRFAAEFGARASLGAERLTDFVLAVSEAAACTVTRGPCTARLRLWASGPRVCCETHSDPLSDRGPRRPDEAEALRRGLLRVLCDYSYVQSGPDGVTVRACMGVN
jgi:hypothetical protein